MRPLSGPQPPKESTTDEALTAQAEAIANTFAPTANRTTDYSKLSDDDKALIYQLSQRGDSHRAIAQVVGCDHSTVSRWLNKLTPTVELARTVARHRALEVTEATFDGAIKAARDGKPEAGLEVLDRLDVAAKRVVDSGRAGNVNIVIGMPGHAAGPDPVINVSTSSASLSPVPRNEIDQ